MRWEKVLPDVRTQGWPLVDSPLAILICTIVYIAVLLKGPQLMKRRDPFQLRNLLMWHSFALVLMNLVIAHDILVGSWRQGYSFWCQPIDVSNTHPDELKIARGMWLFYITKYIDFFDSIFFILRKKSDQLSVLHIYHHSTTPLLTWINIKYFPTGGFALMSLINAFIHIIMYSYYGLSAIGPTMRKYLWWKKYLTIMQLIQFVIAVIWCTHSLVAECNHTAWLDITYIIYVSSLFYLFAIFYRKQYNKIKK